MMRFRLLFGAFLLMSTISVQADIIAMTTGIVDEQVDYQLQPIVVTATRTPHTLGESDANVDVLSSADIQQSTALHLGDVLKLLPGVNIGAFGGIGQNLTLGMRGSTSAQVLIMVDGVPVNDPQYGGLDLNLISLDNVERIEVIRGGASSLYGADALGGVVNLITRSSTYEKPFSSIDYQEGNDDFEKVVARFDSRSVHGVSLNFMASSKEHGGHRINSDYLGRHLSGRINCALGEGGKLSYSTQIYRGELGVPGMDIMPTPKARQEDRSWNQALALQTVPAQGHQLRMTLYRNDNQQEYVNPDWFTKASHRRWTHGFELQHSFAFSDVQKRTAGLELQRRSLDSTENGRHHLDRGALFFQEELDVHSEIRLRLAARFDHHAKFKDQLNPNLTLAWLPSDFTSIFISFGRSYRVPTFNDLYWPTSEYDSDFNGQPDYKESGNGSLKPEWATAFQGGLRAQAGEVSGNVCLFYRKVRDLIQWDNVDQSYLYGFWMPVNRSQATVSGLECQTTALLGKNGQASLTYTYLDAKDDLLNKHLPYQPEHQFAAHLQYGLSVIRKQLEVICRLGVEHIGERYADAREGEKLPSSTVVNGKLTAKVLDRVRVYLVGKNLQDKEYSLRSGYPLPGRTFYGGISWEFWD
ncbi:MAG: hypothetical protein AMJ92_00460 [candidate division Zixibacteria bacterium SM23_81]|nr:MAG: hypothetical protein AMJ92_00460 [candidate division Zixibacteria bacterium SM23_81]